MNILLGVTGSVAATLTQKLVVALRDFGEVRIVVTESAKYFSGADKSGRSIWLGGETFEDADEWPQKGPDFTKYTKGDQVLHIDLKNWADILVIAPCSANTLAKIAHGQSDNLLTSIVRAWPVHKPLFVAPSMNTDMWEKPVTERHIEMMNMDYYAFHCISPQAKTLACGDYGMGAMADINVIVDTIREELRWKAPIHNSAMLFIPEAPHPGAFGAVRKHDVHTGVDLYTTSHCPVSVVEPGIVVDIMDFTGTRVLDSIGKPMSWWNDTQAILVKGVSGVVVYGEVRPVASLHIGDVVFPGQMIAEVIPVLPPHKFREDIPHHSTSMLHIELYANNMVAEKKPGLGTWGVGGPRPDGLLDPTPFLKAMCHNDHK